MAIKIWNATNGKVVSFLYEDGKNKKVLHTREPVEVGDADVANEIDSAMKIFIKYIVRINDMDKLDSGNGGDYGENINQETIDTKIKKEIVGPFVEQNAIDTDVQQEIIGNNAQQKTGSNEDHEEAEHKMSLLYEVSKHSEEKSVKYLIDVNTGKDNGDKNPGSGNGNVEKNNECINEKVKLIPKDDVVRTRTRTRKVSRLFHNYEDALKPHIQELLEKIKNDDVGIVVRIPDMIEELGVQFRDYSPMSVYNGVRHVLFKHGIRVEQCTLKEVDPVTRLCVKGLKMRMVVDGDPVPSTIKKS